MDKSDKASTPQVVNNPPPYGWYPPPFYDEEEEVNLLDYYRVIKKHLKMIVLFTCMVTLGVALLTLMMSKKYKAEATLMPLSQGGGGGGLAALAAQASSIPGVGGQVAGLSSLVGGGAQKGGQIIGILKSRTLLKKVIEKNDLIHVFFKKRWDPEKNSWKPDWMGNVPEITIADAVGYFRKKVLKATEDKKAGFVLLQVEMKDPELAAKVANQIIVELQDFIANNNLTVAKRNRIFIEERLQNNRVDFLEFGKKLNQYYGQNKVSTAQPFVDVDIGKSVGRPLSFQEIRDSLVVIEQQKQETAQKIEEEEKSGIVKEVPSQLYLQYLALQRELLGRANVLLAQQYEMAKIEEAKEDLSFQVIDKAEPPVKPSSPILLLNVAIAFLGALFLSIFWAFFLEYLHKMREKEKMRT